MHKWTTGLVLGVAASTIAVATAGAEADTVDITVVLAIGEDPEDSRTFHVDDAVIGDGIELDLDDETVPNETGFEGAVAVDIDPDARTVTLIPREGGGMYDTIRVEIAGAGFTSISTQSDDLLEPGDEYDLMVAAEDSGMLVAYTAAPSELFVLKGEDAPSPNTAVFGFERTPGTVETTDPTAPPTSQPSMPEADPDPAPAATPAVRQPDFTG